LRWGGVGCGVGGLRSLRLVEGRWKGVGGQVVVVVVVCEGAGV